MSARHRRVFLTAWICGAAIMWATSTLSAQGDLAAGLAKTMWTAEAVRNLRSARDYDGIIALLIAEHGVASHRFRDIDALRAAISRAWQTTQTSLDTSIDPDFNAAICRSRLEQLANKGLIDATALNQLLAELSRPPADANDEGTILGTTDVATGVEFTTFLLRHVSAVYDQRMDPLISGLIETPVGRSQLPPLQQDLAVRIEQSHLPDGTLKTALLQAARDGAVDTAALTAASTSAVQDASNRFKAARDSLKQVVGSQPSFDTLLTQAIPPAVQSHVDKVRGFITGGPDQLVQFDVLQAASTFLPLPPELSGAVRSAAQIGSTIESAVSTVSQVASSLSSLGSVASVGLSFLTTGGIGALAGALGSVFGGGGPSNQQILDAVKEVGEQVQQMHTEMVKRFDQVDLELKRINAKLDEGFSSLHAALGNVQRDLDVVRANTMAIELTILEDRDTLQRAVVNIIGLPNEERLQELHRNVVALRGAVDRANAHVDDMNRERFRELAQYFSTLARSEARQSPLNGLQPSESHDLSLAATRLARPTSLYPLNYLLSFPPQGSDTLTLQGSLSGVAAARNIAADPYVNERAWAIAANAIALMVQTWPAFANEIPNRRVGYDDIIAKGHDIATLVTELQTPRTDLPYSAAFASLRDAYLQHHAQLRAALREALVDEVSAIMTTKGLDEAQRAAVKAAFSATGGPDKSWDAVTDGVLFAKSRINYTPPSLEVPVCGSSTRRTLTGVPLSGDGLRLVSHALALKNVELSGCVRVLDELSTARTAPVPDHPVYGIVRSSDGFDYGNVCAANSIVTYQKMRVRAYFMVRKVGDPDDGAHRSIFAISEAVGPETEYSAKVNGDPHWSGRETADHHEWNEECDIWRRGEETLTYVGDEAYLSANWSGLNWSASQVSFWSGSTASVPYDNLRNLVYDKTKQDLAGSYNTLATDLMKVLHRPAPEPQSNISGNTVSRIAGEAKALEGLRALFRELTTVTFERTLKRDDVLSGLLFGSNALPGNAEMLDGVEDCAHRHNGVTPEVCIGTWVALPTERLARLMDRLGQVTASVRSGQSQDYHELVAATLGRLRTARCLVPTSVTGSSNCSTQP